MRAIDRDDVHPGQHLVEAIPIRGLEPALDLLGETLAIVVVNLQPESACTPGDGLPDPPHADDAKLLAVDAMSQHPGR